MAEQPNREMPSQPPSPQPSPAKTGLVIGLSISLGMLAGKIGGEFGKNLMGESGWWMIGIPATILVATFTAVVVGRLIHPKK